MNISEVKTYLNKTVRFKNSHLHVDSDYLLTACILRQNDKGEYYYLAELTDIRQPKSVAIALLDDITGKETKS